MFKMVLRRATRQNYTWQYTVTKAWPLYESQSKTVAAALDYI